MHQQQPDEYGHGQAPDFAQQPTYEARQGTNVYHTATRRVPNPEYVGHNDHTRGAYVTPSHSPYYSGPQQIEPMMRFGADNWDHQPLLDPRIPYHPPVAQGFFGSEEGQIRAVLASSSQAPDPPIVGSASYPPSAAMHRSWHVSDSCRFSSPADLVSTMESHWTFTGDHPPTYSDPVHYPSTSPLLSPSSTTSEIDAESPIQRQGENFIQESFPGEGSEYERLRLALTEVMNAPWKRQHQMEPDEDLLLQFHRYEAREGKWKCRFSHDGTRCERSTRKKDHAKGHIRCHIDHRPYPCQNPCPAGDVNCTKRYTAMESLKKHQNGKAECKFCKTSMLKGNLQRHIASSCKRSTMPM